MKKFLYVFICWILSLALLVPTTNILVSLVVKVFNVETSSGIHPILGIGLYGFVGMIIFVAYTILAFLLGLSLATKGIHTPLFVQKIKIYWSTISYAKRGVIIGLLFSVYFWPTKIETLFITKIIYTLVCVASFVIVSVAYGKLVKIFSKKAPEINNEPPQNI